MACIIMLAHGSRVSINKVGREFSEENICFGTERTHGSAHKVRRKYIIFFLSNFTSPTIGLLSGISLRTVRMGGNKRKQKKNCARRDSKYILRVILTQIKKRDMGGIVLIHYNIF